MRRAKFTLVLGSPSEIIPLSHFGRAVTKILAILKQLDKEIADGKSNISWGVSSLSMSSPAKIQITSNGSKEGQDPVEIVDYAIDGLSRLNKKAARPKYFSDQLLELARDFSGILDQKNINQLSLINGGSSVSLTRQVVAHVDTLIEAKTKTSMGTIEGKLDLIDVHSGLVVGIYRFTDNICVRAIFKEEQDMRANVLKLLEKPVIAVGEIKRNKRGKPISISVKELKLLSGEIPLSQIEKLYGADPDFTGGLTVEEFLKRQRGEN